MFEARPLASGVLWILGLAVCLAVYSTARWWAYQNGQRLRQMARLPRFVAPFSAGVAIFCLGMALGAAPRWEVILWLVLAVLTAVQAVATCLPARGRRRSGRDEAQEQR